MLLPQVETHVIRIEIRFNRLDTLHRLRLRQCSIAIILHVGEHIRLLLFVEFHHFLVVLTEYQGHLVERSSRTSVSINVLRKVLLCTFSWLGDLP